MYLNFLSCEVKNQLIFYEVKQFDLSLTTNTVAFMIV